MLFRYLTARLRHPGLANRRFIRSGLALEKRSHLLSRFWSEHFSRSRAAQARWSRTCRGELLAVLGAGNLADFHSAALVPIFKRLRLVDGNPLAQSHWGKLGVPVEPVITDITQCIDSWCAQILSAKASWHETMSRIAMLPKHATPAYSAPTDALLSLNILSQLDVGWQEAAESVLRRRFGRSFVSAHEQDWLAAIRPGSQALVERHLAAIEDSGAKFVLLITDVELVEYRGRTYSCLRFEEPPLVWSQQGWQAAPGITFEVIPTLEGVQLNAETLKRFLPSYQLEFEDNWLWHIAPNGTEAADFGKLHRVTALSLGRHDGFSQ